NRRRRARRARAPRDARRASRRRRSEREALGRSSDPRSAPGLRSRIARLEAGDALGVVVDDAGEARIAALGRHARLERRDVLAFLVPPADPKRLRLAERTAPARLLG